MVLFSPGTNFEGYDVLIYPVLADLKRQHFFQPVQPL
jgi:hypothetical protein